MNTAKEEPTQGKQEPEHGGGTQTTCDLEEVETLACTAKKFARQAEVMTEQAVKDLETYRTQFTDARQKYTDARSAAKAELKSIHTILGELYSQLECQLKESQKQCLYQAAGKVFAEIEECSEPMGCESPCDDTPRPDPDTQTDSTALAAEIARRRKNLADSAERFKQLITEPDNIKGRVADLKKNADALVQDVKAGGDGSKVVSWFARWIILDHDATPDQVWHGFDSVSAYVDCLCGLLKCLVSGWATVAILEGRKAELDCSDAGKKKACEEKKKNTLQAILDAYEDCWKPKQESEAPRQNQESPSSWGTSSQSGKQGQGPSQGSPGQDSVQGPAQGPHGKAESYRPSGNYGQAPAEGSPGEDPAQGTYGKAGAY